MIGRTMHRCLASRNEVEDCVFSEGSNDEYGFTLIEIVVSIAVMSIIAVVASIGIIQIAKGYAFSKKNSVVTQQGQIAMARIKKEVSNIGSVATGTATTTSITFTRGSDGTSHTVSWGGGNSPLLIDGDILVQPVNSFNLTYCDSYNPCSGITTPYSTSTSIIEITLQLSGAENSPVTLTDRVYLYQETGG